MTATDVTTSIRGVAGGVRPWEWWALAGLVAAFAVGAGWVASEPTPLGHDESVYALWARHWLEGTPGTGVSDHRAPGLPVLLAIVRAAGFAGEGALRAVGVMAGVATVAATWALGRLVAGAVPGVLAAGLVASSPRMVEESARALTDVPATALVVALAAVLWWQLQRAEGPSWWLLAAAPLAAGAFYLRYAAALPVGLLGLAALAVWWPVVRRHAGKVVAVAAATAALHAPFLVWAVVAHGDPLHPLLAGRAEEDTALGGLARLAVELPFETAGPVWAVAAVAATVLGGRRLAAAVRGGRWDDRARAAAWLLAAGWVVVVVTAAAHRPIPRYLLVAVALLAVLAAAEGWALRSRLGMPARWEHGLLAAAAVGLVVYGFVGTVWVHGNRQWRTLVYEPQRAAVTQLAGETPCAVATGRIPVVTWYSGCVAVSHGELGEREEPRRYVMLVQGGPRQPTGERAAAIRDRLAPPVADEARRTSNAVDGRVDIYALPSP